MLGKGLPLTPYRDHERDLSRLHFGCKASLPPFRAYIDLQVARYAADVTSSVLLN